MLLLTIELMIFHFFYSFNDNSKSNGNIFALGCKNNNYCNPDCWDSNNSRESNEEKKQRSETIISAKKIQSTYFSLSLQNKMTKGEKRMGNFNGNQSRIHFPVTNLHNKQLEYPFSHSLFCFTL